jgi:hypothetical protein
MLDRHVLHLDRPARLSLAWGLVCGLTLSFLFAVVHL